MKIYTFFYDKIDLRGSIFKMQPFINFLINLKIESLKHDVNNKFLAKQIQNGFSINLKLPDSEFLLFKIKSNTLKNEKNFAMVSEYLSEDCLNFEHIEIEISDEYFHQISGFSLFFPTNFNIILLDDKNKITKKKEVISLNSFELKNDSKLIEDDYELLKESFPFSKEALLANNYISFCQRHNIYFKIYHS